MDQSLGDLQDYHFVDNNDDENNKSFVIEKDISKSKHLGAAVLLSDKKLPDGFAENEIGFDQLSSLNSKDLELLGIGDEKARNKMIEEFNELPNQSKHLDKYLSSINLEKYKNNILENMSLHLDNLKTSLSAAELKLMVEECEDVLIGETTYSSEFVIKVLNDMNKNASLIEQQLIALKNGDYKIDDNGEPDMNKKKGVYNSCQKVFYSVAIISGMVGFGLLLFKVFKLSNSNKVKFI